MCLVSHLCACRVTCGERDGLGGMAGGSSLEVLGGNGIT